jgi:hypothetical protein
MKTGGASENEARPVRPLQNGVGLDAQRPPAGPALSLLRDQRCPSCGGRLGRVAWRLLADEASRRESGYSWMDVEGYVPPKRTQP